MIPITKIAFSYKWCVAKVSFLMTKPDDLHYSAAFFYYSHAEL